MDTAYNTGKRAFDKGRKETDNPYSDIEHRIDWYKGFLDAQYHYTKGEYNW